MLIVKKYRSINSDISKKKGVVISFFEETYNHKNYNYVNEYFAPNYFEHRPDGARTNMDAVTTIKGAESIFPNLIVAV